MTNNNKFLELIFGPANTTHLAEIKINMKQKIDIALINLKVFVGNSPVPFVDNTLSFCRLDREMDRNIFIKIYLTQNPIILKTYRILKKCPVDPGFYILRNVTERQEEVDSKIQLPGFNFPEVTFKLAVTAKIVRSKRRETLFNTILTLDVIDDVDET